jgi:hypothetical protein
MGNSLWLQACNVAESRSVIELHRANNIAGSTAVRSACCFDGGSILQQKPPRID